MARLPQGIGPRLPIQSYFPRSPRSQFHLTRGLTLSEQVLGGSSWFDTRGGFDIDSQSDESDVCIQVDDDGSIGDYSPAGAEYTYGWDGPYGPDDMFKGYRRPASEIPIANHCVANP